MVEFEKTIQQWCNEAGSDVTYRFKAVGQSINVNILSSWTNFNVLIRMFSQSRTNFSVSIRDVFSVSRQFKRFKYIYIYIYVCISASSD